jgi:AAA ATPase domain
MDTTSCRLVGRVGECATLDRLVTDVRAGRSRMLVMRGEAGTGKTALLEYLLERAAGCRIARAAGAQSESELAFARLHQLCGPFLDRLGCLPGPQRAALEVAFGLRGGAAPDRFLLGMAVLGLLSDVAGERPLVCAVDDAQWLDRASAQALGFVARHLVDEPVAVIFAVRQPGDEPDLAGVAELVVGGLADSDARGLLESAAPGPLDERVQDRIVAETRGIPRALLEVAGRLTPEQLAGGFGLPGATALCSQIEEGFQRRLAALPAATRRLLLVAAAELAADPVLVWRAAAQLGTGVTAAAPAAGLIEFGGRVRFCHPLARSAIYRAATPEERHRVHHALAEATDPGADPDYRAWHQAHAAPGLDEDAAAELERSVSRARARGGLAAAAAFGDAPPN